MLRVAEHTEAHLESAAHNAHPKKERRGIKRTHRSRGDYLRDTASQPQWVKTVWLGLQQGLLATINQGPTIVAGHRGWTWSTNVRRLAWATKVRRALQWLSDRVEEYCLLTDTVLLDQLEQSTRLTTV